MVFSRKIAKSGFALVLIIMIVYIILVLYSDVEKFSKTIIAIQYWYIPFILLIISLEIVLLGIRFHRFIRRLGINIHITKSILFYIAGLSLNVTPGGAGQIIKSYMIKKEYGEEISKTAPVILVEKWYDLISILLVLVFTIPMQTIEESTITVVGVTVALLIYGIMRYKTPFLFFKKITSKIRPLRRFEETIENSRSALASLSSPKMITEGVLITIPTKILEAVAVFFALYALNVKMNFIDSTHIYFSSLIAGNLSFIPGGFGITESSMVVLLTKYGIDFSLATVSVIFVRLMTIWYSTFLGIIVIRLAGKNKGEDN